LTGCDAEKETAKSTTITVWDYYGSATPIKPVIAAFERAHPEVKVRHVAKDYEAVQTTFGPESTKGRGPDVATLDMTWLSSLADKGVLSDLAGISDGRINGKDIEHVYPSTAIAAMTYRERYVAAPLDFDAYALYYRSDLFAAQKLGVPKTWAELREAAATLAGAADGKGLPGRWRTQVSPDTFHFAQLLFQDGGSLLTAGDERAAFDGPIGVRALTAYRDLLRDGGIYWGPEQDSTGMDAIRDGRIAMFISGPYMMGTLKEGVPGQAGKWGVAAVPALGSPGAERSGYLGGTGLGIPQSSKRKAAAWTFVQFMLQMEQQRGVITRAGAAPTTNEAILSLELDEPDPFFSGQQPQLVFLDALSAGRPMPRVTQWDRIDAVLNRAVEQALRGRSTPQAALTAAAKEVNRLLAAA
jgi:multiple sugar transport system substrate-binding protein